MTSAPNPDQKRIFQRLDRTAKYPYSAGEYLRRFLWFAVQATLVRASLPRAYGWRRLWLRLFGANLAPTARIGRTTRVFHPWLLSIG
jgi:putative colanic acid biosynthesis acetyltransferase WcaF